MKDKKLAIGQNHKNKGYFSRFINGDYHIINNFFFKL